MVFSSTRVTAYIICWKQSFFLFLTALEVSLVTQLFTFFVIIFMTIGCHNNITL